MPSFSLFPLDVRFHCGRVLVFDHWLSAHPFGGGASAGRWCPVSTFPVCSTMDRRRISRVPWVSLLVRTPRSSTPPGPSHLAFLDAWVSSPAILVTQGQSQFKDAFGIHYFRGSIAWLRTRCLIVGPELFGNLRKGPLDCPFADRRL